MINTAKRAANQYLPFLLFEKCSSSRRRQMQTFKAKKRGASVCVRDKYREIQRNLHAGKCVFASERAALLIQSGS